jgi:UTP--glucose-1-phosphate uridylyltransferase
MPVTKAVIPAAGLGTRMLPAAKAVPKELLPVLDRPTIQYVVEEAAHAGISDVVLITSPHKHALQDHFEPNPELLDRLRKTGKESLLASIDSLTGRIRVRTVTQAQQLGLGHAVLQATTEVGDHPFLCLLGDAVFSGGDTSPARQLVDAYARLGTSVIGLEEVPPEKVSRYGIVGGVEASPGVLKLNSLIEKPRIEDAPSRLAIAARYVLSPRIFDCLRQTQPGAGGEIQLTDALRLLLEREPIHGVVLRAHRHDIGNPLDWLKTNLIFARNDPALWPQLAPLIRTLLETP